MSSEGNILSEELIPLAAASSDGSVQEALALADEGGWEFRKPFLKQFAVGVHDRITLGKEIDEQLELVGKVPAKRRARLRGIVRQRRIFSIVSRSDWPGIYRPSH